MAAGCLHSGCGHLDEQADLGAELADSGTGSGAGHIAFAVRAPARASGRGGRWADRCRVRGNLRTGWRAGAFDARIFDVRRLGSIFTCVSPGREKGQGAFYAISSGSTDLPVLFSLSQGADNLREQDAYDTAAHRE